jgi:hypothetical protein
MPRTAARNRLEDEAACLPAAREAACEAAAFALSAMSAATGGMSAIVERPPLDRAADRS